MLNFIEAEAGKRRVELETTELLPFEEKILTSGCCGAAPPAVILSVEGRRIIRYDITGLTRFADYPFRHADQVLGVLYEIPLLLLDAEDRLLRADKFALNEESLFVNAKSLTPALFYGATPDEGAGFRAAYYSLLALPRTWDHITGLPDAVRRVEKRISIENPDMKNLLRIVETVRREWNIIHPYK
jgi:hypothetical protein